MTARDPYAPLKERAWKEVADVDDRLERGDIDEDQWFAAMAEMVTEPYLSRKYPLGRLRQIRERERLGVLT